jgi:hypothetical protein
MSQEIPSLVHARLCGRQETSQAASRWCGHLSLLPTPDMDRGQRKNLEPIAVGSLELYYDRLAGLVSISTDVLPAIPERFKFIVMGGGKFRHRRARLHRFRLEMKQDEADLPAEAAET